MGLFDKSTNLPTHISFSTRSEAFTYMLNYLMSEKKMEPMEAAKQANEFAEIFLAVECADDNERDIVQSLANELSNSRILNARTLINMKPMFDKNRNELIQLFDMISQNGIGSILSVKGGMIISKLAKRK